MTNQSHDWVVISISVMPLKTFFNLPPQRQQLIIEVAINEFANHSYEAASISSIVNEAKIAKGSFYQYFENKQDLYLYLVDRALEERDAFIVRADLPSIHMGFFVYLRALFQVVLEFQLANPAYTQILFRTPNHGDLPFREEVFKRTKAALTDFMRLRIQQGIALGQLAADLNPDIAAFIIVTLASELRRFIPAYLGLTVKPLVKEDPELNQDAIDKIMDEFISTLEHGMARRDF